MRDIRKNPHSMYAREPQAMAQSVLKIEKLSHIMGPTPILEMARAYGLRPRLWLLIYHVKFNVCLVTKPLGVFSSETKWLNASLLFLRMNYVKNV